jgi:hypothetical protein
MGTSQKFISRLCDANMLRASTGNGNDSLVQLLRKTCYADAAEPIASLVRKMIVTYHNADMDEGDRQAKALSAQVFDCIASARQRGTVGLAQVYEVVVNSCTYRFLWQRRLARGCYNHVYYGTITARTPHATRAHNAADGTLAPDPQSTARGKPASSTTLASDPQRASDSVEMVVVKVTAQPDSDLRVYVLENVINAVLANMDVMRDMVVPIHFPFKVAQSNRQIVRLGVVLQDPGHGHVGELIERMHQKHAKAGGARDRVMFAMLTALAAMLEQAQRAIQFQHRDLKCDNIMWVPVNETMQRVMPDDPTATFQFPSSMKFLFIDFGMARFMLDGEHIACDCMTSSLTFNPASDLQNLCCTMVEDYGRELADMAPDFFKWIAGLCEPLFVKAREAALPRTYRKLPQESRHKLLTTIVNEEKVQYFVPSSMLAVLKVYWQSV